MSVRAPGSRPRLVTMALTGLLLLFASSPALAGGGTFLGPTPYLSVANSPFLADLSAGSMYLDTFECGAVVVPGITLSAGTVIPPGFEGNIDSVDADDGAIDGSGLGGHSLFSGSGSAGITVTFSQATLGAFPTRVGIVWTDGSGTTTFEAFDALGASLGTVGPVDIADGSNSGTTAEDRFFGVIFAGGISAIRISNTAGGIEVDHLQYGLYDVGKVGCGVPTPVPTALVTGTPTSTPTSTPTGAPTSTPTRTPTSTATAVAATQTPIPAPVAGPAVPTLSFPMLALLAIGLAGAAILLIRGT